MLQFPLVDGWNWMFASLPPVYQCTICWTLPLHSSTSIALISFPLANKHWTAEIMTQMQPLAPSLEVSCSFLISFAVNFAFWSSSSLTWCGCCCCFWNYTEGMAPAIGSCLLVVGVLVLILGLQQHGSTAGLPVCASPSSTLPSLTSERESSVASLLQSSRSSSLIRTSVGSHRLST
mgnify:CR=1 FL=1